MVLFLCCKDNKTQLPYGYIDLESGLTHQDIHLLSEVAEDITYIFLETNDNCLISDISKVRYDPPYYFIMDMQKKAIVIFNETGGFVNKIDAFGQGPGEYTRIWDFDVYDHIVYIFDDKQRKILKYGINGEFINSFKIEEYANHLKVNKEDEILLAIANFNLKSNENQIFSLYDKNFILKEKFKQMESTGSEVFSAVSSFYKHRDTLVYWEYNIFDTIYNIVLPDKYTEMRYFIDKGKLTSSLVNKYEEAAIVKDGQFQIGNILETDNYVFLFCINNKYFKVVLYDKIENQTLGVEPSFLNDIDGGMNFWPVFKLGDNKVGDSKFPFFYKNYFKKEVVDYYEGFNFNNYRPKLDFDDDKHTRLLDQLNKTDDMSNPILRIVTMKSHIHDEK